MDDRISMGRASQNIDEILKGANNPFGKKQENIFDAEEEEDDNSIFGPSKTRIKDKLLNKHQIPIGVKMESNIKAPNSKKEEEEVDSIMSRQTFNENALIKKRVAEVVE